MLSAQEAGVSRTIATELVSSWCSTARWRQLDYTGLSDLLKRFRAADKDNNGSLALPECVVRKWVLPPCSM